MINKHIFKTCTLVCPIKSNLIILVLLRLAYYVCDNEKTEYVSISVIISIVKLIILLCFFSVDVLLCVRLFFSSRGGGGGEIKSNFTTITYARSMQFYIYALVVFYTRNTHSRLGLRQ